MMARSTTRSNQRPDTLMQDRHRQFDEIFLQRTAGPYIRVNRAGLTSRRPLPFYHPQSTDIIRPGLLIRLVPEAEVAVVRQTSWPTIRPPPRLSKFGAIFELFQLSPAGAHRNGEASAGGASNGTQVANEAQTCACGC